MRDWISSVPFRCGICGGIVPRYVWWEKEVFKQAVLFEGEECQCPWHARMAERLELTFHSSRAVSLQWYKDILKENGVPLERSS